MKISRVVWIAVAMLAVTSAAAQTNVRVRGTIAAIDGNALTVKSRDGRDLKVQLADNVSVAVAKAIRFDEIKQGDYVGATTKPGPDGSAVAIEVHYLAPTTPEGQLAWDLQPGSTMTNANVGAIVQAAGIAVGWLVVEDLIMVLVLMLLPLSPDCSAARVRNSMPTDTKRARRRHRARQGSSAARWLNSGSSPRHCGGHPQRRGGDDLHDRAGHRDAPRQSS